MRLRFAFLPVLGLLAACEVDTNGPAQVSVRNGLGPAISRGSPGTAGNHAVAVGDNGFDPAAVAIEVGDTVTWTWTGIRPHSVTFQNGLRDSGVKSSGTYQLVFTVIGTSNYFSVPDSGMNGTVTVR